MDYNTIYYNGDTPVIYYDGAGQSPSYINTQYGVSHNVEQNPSFIDLNGSDNNHGTVDDNYSLDGTYINNGEDLSACFEVTIQGTLYTMCYDDALDPDNTDWTTTPPTVSTLKQDSYGAGWERGVYVYVP